MMGRISRTGYLFQARLWREYAQAWDGSGIDREWVEKVLRVSRTECIRRAREALRLSRQARKANTAH